MIGPLTSLHRLFHRSQIVNPKLITASSAKKDANKLQKFTTKSVQPNGFSESQTSKVTRHRAIRYSSPACTVPLSLTSILKLIIMADHDFNNLEIRTGLRSGVAVLRCPSVAHKCRHIPCT